MSPIFANALLLFQADNDSHEFYHLTFDHRQEDLMYRCLATPANLGVDWWNYALREDSHIGLSCTWRGIECEDGKIVGLALTYNAYAPFQVRISLLPQTIKFLHFEYAQVFDFSLRDLPRNLRSVFMQDGGVGTKLFTFAANEDCTFDSALLPRKLETADMRFGNTPTLRTVLLRDLPRSLLYVHISNGHNLNCVLVDNSGLPDGLDVFHVHGKRNAVQVSTFDDTDADKRIDVSEKIPWCRSANHFERYGNISNQIRREIGLLNDGNIL